MKGRTVGVNAMTWVSLRRSGRRIVIQGCPRHVKPKHVQYAVKAVIWRMQAEGDPEAIGKWHKWAERHAPGARQWGQRRPLTATVSEVMQVIA